MLLPGGTDPTLNDVGRDASDRVAHVSDEIARLAEELATARAELAALRRTQENWAEQDAKTRAQRDRAVKTADELSVALAQRLRIDTAGAAGSRSGVALFKRGQQPVTKQEAAQLELIRGSVLFDEAWYLRTHHDVAHLGEDPALHFLRHPYDPLRQPSAAFDVFQYVADHPRVYSDRANPLVAFLLSPESEGADAYPPRPR